MNEWDTIVNYSLMDYGEINSIWNKRIEWIWEKIKDKINTEESIVRYDLLDKYFQELISTVWDEEWTKDSFQTKKSLSRLFIDREFVFDHSICFYRRKRHEA